MLNAIAGLFVTSLAFLYVVTPLAILFLNKQPTDPRIDRIGSTA